MMLRSLRATLRCRCCRDSYARDAALMLSPNNGTGTLFADIIAMLMPDFAFAITLQWQWPCRHADAAAAI